ncbi:MAG TPA: hypothetical protein VIB61_01385 [Microbacteriaceae bacterium]
MSEIRIHSNLDATKKAALISVISQLDSGTKTPAEKLKISAQKDWKTYSRTRKKPN